MNEKVTIAGALRTLMLEKGETRAWTGNPDLMLEAYTVAGGPIRHPLDRIQAVLRAARRLKHFATAGCIRP